jgi:hypothetical protein
MKLVQLPSITDVHSSEFDRALDRYMRTEGVVGIFVPESRWPFLDHPPHIIWRGPEDRAMAIACLQVHRAANYEPVRLHIGPLTLYARSHGCQTCGLVVRTNSAAVKSVARLMRQILKMAVETP